MHALLQLEVVSGKEKMAHAPGASFRVTSSVRSSASLEGAIQVTGLRIRMGLPMTMQSSQLAGIDMMDVSSLTQAQQVGARVVHLLLCM